MTAAKAATADFSRTAGHVLNAPYWYEDYTGTDTAECIRFHQARSAEKELLTGACAKIESVGGSIDSLPQKARAVWDRAVRTLGADHPS